MKQVLLKHLKILCYLIGSGLLGWIISYYMIDKPELTMIIGPAINYVVWVIEKELAKEGIREALRK